MLLSNPHALRTHYPADLAAIMNIQHAQASRRWLAPWKELASAATPLYVLPDLAGQLQLACVHVKDESVRSSLGSFKALGAPVALIRQVLRLYPESAITPEDVLAGRHAQLLQNYTVISATDGNHGRSLAAAARCAGCRCVIVLHAQVSAEREAAIAAFGAKIVRIEGNYDESVEVAAQMAQDHGWQVISDTSYEGYEDIPRDVMQGYGTIAAELVEQAAGDEGRSTFTHIFLQGGVGGLAAGIVSYFWELYGANRPRFIVVEPAQADCLYQSALYGRAGRATGTVESIMAGLACGETSPLAWRFLQPAVDYFLTIDDELAIEAMRKLATGSEDDIPIVAGESGAAGLAGLLSICDSSICMKQLGLDTSSRVLVINTEGATAPSVYRELTGVAAEMVLSQQKNWKDAHHGNS
ncbi:diaminopropionate ammonia-lyase [Undibacterium sp. TS12]|uniref:diaminopropionate ammonia-lyase n=1 Tax=Undibacterium sp. TS12 TaxID=2908202 RepID=UPI001F4CEE6C|nr:diaminopropionate ammonia-lyase [Undibacterium sp. TS12]MCH8620442.1 diaminopropionate ammonia-lyase [Undibacterium sp. TS12]